eukprot:2910562-Amphidinium_carterae.1
MQHTWDDNTKFVPSSSGPGMMSELQDSVLPMLNADSDVGTNSLHTYATSTLGDFLRSAIFM